MRTWKQLAVVLLHTIHQHGALFSPGLSMHIILKLYPLLECHLTGLLLAINLHSSLLRKRILLFRLTFEDVTMCGAPLVLLCSEAPLGFRKVLTATALWPLHISRA